MVEPLRAITLMLPATVEAWVHPSEDSDQSARRVLGWAIQEDSPAQLSPLIYVDGFAGTAEEWVGSLYEVRVGADPESDLL